VALIGITLPIGMSYILMGLLGATPVQAFAAGAALCSTSLGTTFTILSTSGLEKSRLGVILSSAAMLDDVAGLVMVQVISNLGGSADSFSAVTVIRPVFVSIAFAVVVPAFCWAVVKPITKYVFCQTAMAEKDKSKMRGWICTPVSAFAAHTLVLLGLVTGSTYAGTSNLFAAYIAGAVINWWDALVSTTLQEKRSSSTPGKNTRNGKKGSTSSGGPVTTLDPSPSDGSTPVAHAPATAQSTSNTHDKLKGAVICEHMYAPAMNSILKPFFFVSTCSSLSWFPALTSMLGFHRLFHSNHSHVSRCYRLARHSLYYSHDLGQVGLRPYTRPLYKHTCQGPDTGSSAEHRNNYNERDFSQWKWRPATTPVRKLEAQATSASQAT
jgi:hypothetical protein